MRCSTSNFTVSKLGKVQLWLGLLGIQGIRFYFFTAPSTTQRQKERIGFGSEYRERQYDYGFENISHGLVKEKEY